MPPICEDFSFNNPIVKGQVIYRIGASDLLYYRSPTSNVPFWGKWSTVLGQVINCVIVPLSQIHRLGQVIYRIGASDLKYYRPPQSNVPFWGKCSTVLGQVIYCIIIHRLGQVIYRIGASDKLYNRPPQPNPPFEASDLPYWGKWSTVL